jgi:hypothetical protein
LATLDYGSIKCSPPKKPSYGTFIGTKGRSLRFSFF